ncbi:MAG: hypothetical protein P4L98_04395 [Ancalomicrobiaceae bacterium]|nr:hypothetical protein [Ancalomicrobiaceae bacterium]
MHASFAIVDPVVRRFRAVVYGGTMGLALGLALPSHAVAAEASGDVEISIDYTYAFDRMEPDPETDVKTHRTLTLTLMGSGQIRQSIEVHSKIATPNSKGPSVETDDLGKEGKRATWHVAGPAALEGRLKWGDGTLVVTVTTAAEGTHCKAAFKLETAPGGTGVHLKMRSQPGVTGLYTHFRIEKSACTAKKV